MGARITEPPTSIPTATKINLTSMIPAATRHVPGAWQGALRGASAVCRLCQFRRCRVERLGALMINRLDGGIQGRRSVAQILPGDYMTDTELRGNKRQRGLRTVELRIAARLENLAMLRTLVAAIGTFEDLDFDAVADLRLAVDEVCTRLIRSAIPGATLAIVVDPRDDELVVEASATCDNCDVVTPGSFSWHVLTSLTDDVQTFHDGREPDESRVFGISMTARRASSLR